MHDPATKDTKPAAGKGANGKGKSKPAVPAVAHVPKRISLLTRVLAAFNRDNAAVPAAAASRKVAKPPLRWISDSGSGEDLIGRQYYTDHVLEHAELQESPLALDAANGEIVVKFRLPVKSRSLKSVVHP